MQKEHKTNEIDLNAIDLFLATRAAKELFLKRDAETLDFFQKARPFKEIIPFEQRAIEGLRLVSFIEQAIAVQCPNGSITYEKETRAIKKNFLRLKKDLTERREAQENNRNANRFKHLELIVGLFAFTGATVAAIKKLSPESSDIADKIQFGFMTSVVVLMVQHRVTAFCKNALKNTRIHAYFSARYAKENTIERAEDVLRGIMKKDNNHNILGPK